MDLDYLNDISGGDPKYIYEVLTLFIETFPAGMTNLEQLVRETDDYDAIHKQAHTLKSSAGIVRIRGLFDDLSRIALLARNKSNKEEIVTRLDSIIFNFNKAVPFIQSERTKCRAADPEI